MTLVNERHRRLYNNKTEVDFTPSKGRLIGIHNGYCQTHGLDLQPMCKKCPNYRPPNRGANIESPVFHICEKLQPTFLKSRVAVDDPSGKSWPNSSKLRTTLHFNRSQKQKKHATNKMRRQFLQKKRYSKGNVFTIIIINYTGIYLLFIITN